MSEQPFPAPEKNFFVERNNASQEELATLVRRLSEYRWYDAMVTEANLDNRSNKYKVNIHMSGISVRSTHRDVVAINPNPSQTLVKGHYCKAIMDGRNAIIMPWTGIVKLSPDEAATESGIEATPRRVQGWLGDAVKGVSSEYLTPDYRVSMTYSYSALGDASPNYTTNANGLKLKDLFSYRISFNVPMIGFLWPSPTIVGDYSKESVPTSYVSLGLLIAEGGKLPTPTAKYQVLTVLDDALTPIWDYERFT